MCKCVSVIELKYDQNELPKKANLQYFYANSGKQKLIHKEIFYSHTYDSNGWFKNLKIKEILHDMRFVFFTEILYIEYNESGKIIVKKQRIDDLELVQEFFNNGKLKYQGYNEFTNHDTNQTGNTFNTYANTKGPAKFLYKPSSVYFTISGKCTFLWKFSDTYSEYDSKAINEWLIENNIILSSKNDFEIPDEHKLEFKLRFH